MIRTTSDRSAGVLLPNWLDDQTYRTLLDLDRPGWAWEWLRRNPDYVEATQCMPQYASTVSSDPGLPSLTVLTERDAARWGLLFPGESGPFG